MLLTSVAKPKVLKIPVRGAVKKREPIKKLDTVKPFKMRLRISHR